MYPCVFFDISSGYSRRRSMTSGTTFYDEVFQITPVQVLTHQPTSRKMRNQIRSRVLHPLRRNETGSNISSGGDGDLNPQHGLMKPASASSPQNSRCDLKINDKTYNCARFLLHFSDFLIKIISMKIHAIKICISSIASCLCDVLTQNRCLESLCVLLLTHTWGTCDQWFHHQEESQHQKHEAVQPQDSNRSAIVN